MNIKNIKRFFIFFSFIFSVILLSKVVITTESKKDVFVQKDITQKHVMTIFVHGTILPIPSFKGFKELFKKSDKQVKKKSFYAQYIKNIRFKCIYQYQPIGEFGLIEINQKGVTGPRNVLVSKLYESIYTQSVKNDNVSFSFYTFGWDGRLDSKKRKQWAFELYSQLMQEIENLKKRIKDKELFVEILAHSHGGNVVLNLALAEEAFKKNLSVDRIVLFGTPIQSETKDLIHSSIFKKIYNIYSTADPMQVIDFISTKDSFSKRHFKIADKKENESGDFSKLTQIEVRVGTMRPLHNELWFMKEKGNFLYRKKFALNPLPVSTFTPLITTFVETNFEGYNDLILHVEKNDDALIGTFEKRKSSKDDESVLLSKPTQCSCSFPNVTNLKNQIRKKSA